MISIREYADAIATETNATVVTVTKNGVNLTGLTPKTGATIKPTVYVDNMYENGEPLEKAVEKVRETFRATPPIGAEEVLRSIATWANVKDKVTIRLLKAGEYDLCKDATGYGFPGLVLVPYIELPEIDGSIRITAKQLEALGVTEETVMEAAIKNIANNFTVTDMNDMLTTLLTGDLETEIPAPVTPTTMLVVTNRDKMYGAVAAITAAPTLKAVFPEGYVVLPSSVHEVIVISAKDFDDDRRQELTEMVQEVNRTQVDPIEQLSDEVYLIRTATSAA